MPAHTTATPPDAVAPKPRRRRTLPDTPALLVTRQEAAAITGLPGSSLYDLIATGTLPVVRLPHTRRLWIRRTDLLHLIERSTERGGGQ